MQTTLADAKPIIARTLGMKVTDSRVVEYINEAIQRLLFQGKWVGTTARYQFCTYGGCIVLPRHIETMEAYALNSIPGRINSPWFEFIANGPGVQSCDTCNSTDMLDRGETCAFADIQGDNSLLYVISDQPEDDDAVITLMGRDENDLWVRTTQSGTLADGEQVAINNTGTYSTTVWAPAGLARVIKPETVGTVYVYEYDQDTTVMRRVAVYEWDETNPIYRKYFLPGVSTCDGCCTSPDEDATCTSHCITAMCKLRFIPAANDTDQLLIGNVPAIKDMVQSIRFAENNLLQQAAAYETKAVLTLQRELQSHMGDGPIVRLRTENREIFGAGSIETINGAN